MKFIFIGVVAILLLNVPAQARPASEPVQPVGAACQQGVINPWPTHLVHHTAFVGDSVVGAAPNACCRATCTQMLSTTRLDHSRKPART